MLDSIIANGLVVDGTGASPVRGDIGIKSGKIVAVGEVDEPAARRFDADGLVVTPGFVDPHTHYDAQLFWDPLATPSSWHGVTTVIGGNCGFTLAPLKERDADYTRRMMAQVEGMPLAGLEEGLPWSWESFGEYLDLLEGSVAVNAGFMVGHCALRRYVLGDDFGREATADEQSRILDLLGQSLAAGGLGLSTTRSSTHIDGEGGPVPSRWASVEELLALCELVGTRDGTSLEMINDGCINRFSDEDVELLARMSATAKRPLNWNVLFASSDDPERIDHQLQPSLRAREMGGRVVALTMPVMPDSNVSLLAFSPLWLIPGWRDVLAVDVPERIRRLKDPAVRAGLIEKSTYSDDSRPWWARLADFSHYRIGDVYSEQNEPYRNRIIGEIAAERGEDSFTTAMDIMTADDLQTTLWPAAPADTDADWALRRHLWDNPDVLLGGSDAGAHIDNMLGSPYPSRFLGDTLRGRKLVSLERAVQLMTGTPAQLFGLRGRGRLAAGYQADIVVLDPDRIGAGPPRFCHDMPADSKRLVADSEGILRVLVNGRETIVEGHPTGERPGVVLRSGRDTTNGPQ